MREEFDESGQGMLDRTDFSDFLEDEGYSGGAEAIDIVFDKCKGDSNGGSEEISIDKFKSYLLKEYPMYKSHCKERTAQIQRSDPKAKKYAMTRAGFLNFTFKAAVKKASDVRLSPSHFIFFLWRSHLLS